MIDGDTVEVKVHLWLGMDQTVLVRVAGIDTPELKGRCPGEPEAAAAARDHLAKRIGAGVVWVSAVRRDKFGGRVVASLRLPSGEDVAAIMLAAGHARATTGGRVSWCQP